MISILLWKPQSLPKCYEIGTMITEMAIKVRVESIMSQFRTMEWNMEEFNRTVAALSHIFEIFSQMAKIDLTGIDIELDSVS